MDAIEIHFNDRTHESSLEKDMNFRHKYQKKYRIMFSEEENTKIKTLVEKFGTDSWKMVADNLPGRTARQCRERWKNYLAPEINKKPWKSDEDILLFRKFQEIGPQWVLMSSFFTKRTQNAIKNRWNTIIRKARNLGFESLTLEKFIETAQRVDFRSNRSCTSDENESEIHDMHYIISIENFLVKNNKS